MDRESRLLGIIDAQTEIAAARLEPREVMELVTRRALGLTGADAAVIELLDGDELVFAHAAGAAEGHDGLRLHVDRSLSGLAVRETRTMRSDDTRCDPRVDGEMCREVGNLSMICVPLLHDGDPVGALMLYAGEPDRFNDDDEETLTLLSGVIAAHIRHAEEFARNERLSRRDSLTDVGNRRAYDERLGSEVARAHRAGVPLSLVLLDVDGLKELNDSYGHLAGDTMLRTVAKVLGESARAADDVFRIGGDEFAVLLPGAAQAEADVVAGRFAAALSEHRTPRGPMRASSGVAELLGSDPLALHAQADARLYDAKIARALA
jgi:diguanylate cyclase (GGDEF)-like protein